MSNIGDRAISATPAPPLVEYRHWRVARRDRAEVVARYAAEARTVCEVGAGANPALPPEVCKYVIDASEAELAKSDSTHKRLIADLSDPYFEPPEQFDLVFSFATVEHVADPDVFHRNIARMLCPGGRAIHFFSTLYSFPFVANRLLPERLGQWLLVHLVDQNRRSSGSRGKFRAYYRWCRGPLARQIKRLQETGYTVELYRGYFGHDYYRRVPMAQSLLDAFARVIVRHPVPWWTSYALIVLQRVD